MNCNFVKIREEVAELVASGIDFVHLDVMDGNFVDDITFGPSFVRSLVQEFPGVQFEVHMMVNRPFKFIEPMANAGVHRYIFHYEVTSENQNGSYSVKQLADEIHNKQMEAAIAINPATEVEVLLPHVSLVESVLIMTVVPGLGGQKFMVSMMDKVSLLRAKHPELDIELDGGVAPTNTAVCGQAGANRIVVGTALLRSNKKPEDVKIMRNELFKK